MNTAPQQTNDPAAMAPSADQLASAAKEMESFKSGLETDIIIELSIGTDNKPLRIQQSVLTSISEYFVKAIQHQGLGGGKPGTLNFPDDSLDAWLILLWWRTKGEIPVQSRSMAGSETISYIEAWVLGDKYGIPEFQNVVMFELLHYLSGDDRIRLEHAELAFHRTMPASPLRTLVAEDLAVQIRDTTIGPAEFSMLDGATGAIVDVLAALAFYDAIGGDVLYEKRLDNRWKEFMVGDADYCHWAYRRKDAHDYDD